MLTSQTSQRSQDHDRLYHGHPRRGHAAQISISDDNHHVTDAIGSMYGDEDEPTPHEYHHRQRQNRPLSFVPSPLGDTIQPKNAYPPPNARPGMPRTPSYEKRGPILGQGGSPTSHRSPHSPGSTTEFSGSRGGAGGSMNGQGMGNGNDGSAPSSPSLNRSPSEASQHFPITDLDSSAAVAQELSNLQAIRRMSMDVHAADPDLPSFNGGSFHVPATAPAPDADEEDPATMFWVPASVHPELAPKAFESFIQDRVKTIKRSSLSASLTSEGSSLSPAGSEAGSLRRKKSMLSRQVNDGSGYQDGAERLERQRSSVQRDSDLPSLQELEELASDPSSLVRRLSIDGSRSSLEAAPEAAEGQDMPILPSKPLGQGLKRSTKTTYRRGSQRKGDRLASRRIPRGAHESEHDEPPVPSLPKPDEIPQLPNFSSDLGSFDNGSIGGLQRVQTEPVPKPRAVENFSRPGRKAQTPPLPQDEFDYSDGQPVSPEERQRTPPDSHMFPPRGSSARSPPPTAQSFQVPTIVETPPPSHDHGRPQSAPGVQRPDRMSSMDQQPPSQPPQAPPPNRPQRPQLNRPASLQQSRGPQQKTTFDQMGVNQQPLPIQSTRTDNISIIPTYADEKKSDKKGKDKKDEETKKSGWSWLTGGEKEKEKDSAKKSKQKLQRPAERGHDDTRLDVLQTQIDGGKPRESLVLDRSSIQIDAPKMTGRKSSADSGKKEKDSGLFSSLFGGSKKNKSDKEHSSSSGKKSSSLRGLSPEPPQRRLQPDVDYNWSRFSILEERAIYRMAHIKLANPRRELYSQVLLSNFMYSYLAKVQQMHPQMQVPLSAAQKKANAQAKKAQEQQAAAQAAAGSGGQQPEEFAQYQRYQEQQARNDGSSSPGNNAGPQQQHPPQGGTLINNARNAPPPQQQQDGNSQQGYNQYGQYGQANGGQGGYGNYSGGGGGGHGGAQQRQEWDYSQGSGGGGTNEPSRSGWS